MPDRYRIAGVLAAGAGLRQGEVLGLTVDRVNFLRRELRVDRQMVTPAHGEPALGPVKSNASIRTVPLADAVLEALAGHLSAFPAGPDGLVVTYVDGRPVRRNRFGAMWRQSQAGVGLPHRYHDLSPPLRQCPHCGRMLREGRSEGARPRLGPGDVGHLRPPLARLGRPDPAGHRRRARFGMCTQMCTSPPPKSNNRRAAALRPVAGPVGLEKVHGVRPPGSFREVLVRGYVYCRRGSPSSAL